MAPTTTVKRYIKELARRARGEAPQPLHAVAVDPSGDIGAHLLLAADHADMGTVVPPEARMRAVKQGMVRASRLFTHHQVLFNHAVIDALVEVDAALGDGPGSTKGAAAMAALEVLVQDLEDQVGALRRDNEALRTELSALRSSQLEDRTSTRVLRSTVETVLREARTDDDDTKPTERAARRRLLDERHDELYRAFEQTFRGTRQQVRELCQGYVDELAAAGSLGGRVLDIGCGRGELLELLGEAGVDAYGVEVNDRQAAAGQDLGLEIVVDDALAHLRSLPEGSLAAVTALHVAEHLSLDDLVDLVDLALRALRPGGKLVLETPNTMTWQVGANWFYLDPTHLKPLHPFFLDFLVRDRGFVDVDLRWLHPADEARLAPPAVEGEEPLLGQVVERLNQVFAGAQDYAVVGVRP